MKTYPLEIENIGDDTYRLMSRGHHDPAEFMRKVREDYDWPMGMPIHLWFRAVPDASGECICRYVEARPGGRGVFPVTYAHEAYGQDTYEAQTTNSK